MTAFSSLRHADQMKKLATDVPRDLASYIVRVFEPERSLIDEVDRLQNAFEGARLAGVPVDDTDLPDQETLCVSKREADKMLVVAIELVASRAVEESAAAEEVVIARTHLAKARELVDAHENNERIQRDVAARLRDAASSAFEQQAVEHDRVASDEMRCAAIAREQASDCQMHLELAIKQNTEATGALAQAMEGKSRAEETVRQSAMKCDARLMQDRLEDAYHNLAEMREKMVERVHSDILRAGVASVTRHFMDSDSEATRDEVCSALSMVKHAQTLSLPTLCGFR